jgi:2-polyprenyl-3-methyl-5-hydroxy-6-metoxy-1,4-benzoquinol methylase
METKSFVELDPRYRNSSSSYPHQLIGIYPLGNGGLLEVAYRHYFEFQHLKSLVSLNSTINILELGSGNGRWALSIAPLVKHYTGVDLSREAIDISIRDCQVKQIRNVDFHNKSITDFLGDRFYDLVYFSGVTQYLEDAQIHGILRNLSPWFKPNTCILDRSTVNFHHRSAVDRGDYFSIYRTSQEIIDIFAAHGLLFQYQSRSYRYMRGSRWLFGRPILDVMPKLIDMAKPFSYYGMLFIFWLVDFVKPISFEQRGWSHDFFLFKMGTLR